jgi:hypothetical protein
MRRRDFIGLLGGAAAIPFVACPAEWRIRSIGVLPASRTILYFRPASQRFIKLALLGWIIGRNVRIDTLSPTDPAKDSQ